MIKYNKITIESYNKTAKRYMENVKKLYPYQESKFVEKIINSIFIVLSLQSSKIQNARALGSLALLFFLPLPTLFL